MRNAARTIRRSNVISEPVIATERLQLREYAEGDLDALAAHLGDRDTMTFYPRTKNRAEAAAWMQRSLDSYRDHGFGHWVVTFKGEDSWIGDVGFWVQDVDGRDEIELGWHVLRRWWRRGIATEAGLACVRYGSGALGLKRIVSMIRPENTPSVGVAERLGMHLERTLEWRGFEHGIYVASDRSQSAGRMGP